MYTGRNMCFLESTKRSNKQRRDRCTEQTFVEHHRPTLLSKKWENQIRDRSENNSTALESWSRALRGGSRLQDPQQTIHLRSQRKQTIITTEAKQHGNSAGFIFRPLIIFPGKMHIFFSEDQLKLLRENVFFDVEEMNNASWSRQQQDSRSPKSYPAHGRWCFHSPIRIRVGLTRLTFKKTKKQQQSFSRENVCWCIFTSSRDAAEK